MPSTEPPIIYEKRDGVAYITMNRPEKRNALNPEAFVRMADALLDYRDDDSLRCVIITGAGDQAFTAGADLGIVIPLLTKAREPQDEWDRRMLADRLRAMAIATLFDFECYKPVILAINGAAIGGGTEMMHFTDIRLAVPHATFGVAEVKRGLWPGASVVPLPSSIPYCKAMEILLLGEPITAQEAWRIGLINEVVPKEQLMERARWYAERIAENAPVSVRKIKEAVIRTRGIPLPEGRAISQELGREVGRTEDAREGPRAFAEKRKPVFKGR